MDAAIPCTRIVALLEPHYPKARQARQSPRPVKMLRIKFPRHRFNLSDSRAEAGIYDCKSMRPRFAGKTGR